MATEINGVIATLTDRNGNVKFPRTVAEAVDVDGQNLNDILVTKDELNKINKSYPILNDEVNVKNVSYPYGHVKRFGAVGNANYLNPNNMNWYADESFTILSNDDTDAFINCFNWTTSNGEVMLLGNGHYAIDTKLSVSPTSIDSEEADIPVYINGETPFSSTIDRYTMPANYRCDHVIDVQFNKKVYLRNIGSKYSSIKYYDVSTTFNDINEWRRRWAYRDVFVENVLSFSDKNCKYSTNLYISSPAPNGKDYKNISTDWNDSNYCRYPLEITNNSGYNAIEINNFCYDDNHTDKPSQPQENSALGIIDMVSNSTGVIFIDMKGLRSFERFIRTSANIQSSVRPGTVFEVHHNGHLAIGCTVDESEFGVSTVKLRDNSPKILYIDANNNDTILKQGISVNSDGNEKYEIKFINDDGTEVGFSMKLVDGKVQFSGFRWGGINDGVRLNQNSDKPYESGLVLYNSSDNQRSIQIDSNNRLRYASPDQTNIKEGTIIQPVNGNTSSLRPTNLTNHWRDIGYMYFDTSLNKPIWWNGTGWVDANGTTV